MFIDRIEEIADGRVLTPWLTSLGWISNDVTRIRKGLRPGTDKLERLARAEHVSLTWLLTGIGMPFLVDYSPTAGFALRTARATLGPRPDGGDVIHVVSHDGSAQRALLVLRYGPQRRELRVLVGELGDTAVQLASTTAVREIELPIDRFLAIAFGRTGRWRLLDAPDALLGAFVPSRPVGGRLAAPSPPVTSRGQLQALIDQLDADQCEVLWRACATLQGLRSR